MKFLYFSMNPLDRTRGSSSQPNQINKTEKTSAKLDSAGMNTKNKIVQFIEEHYQPVTEWESNKTFEEVLQKTHARKIAQQEPTQESSLHFDVAAKRIAGG